MPYTKSSTPVDMRQEGDSNGRIAGHRTAMAGGCVRDECVNDPNGFRDGGSASDTDMHDLQPGAQPQESSLYRTVYTKSTRVSVRQEGHANGRNAGHRNGWEREKGLYW